MIALIRLIAGIAGLIALVAFAAAAGGVIYVIATSPDEAQSATIQTIVSGAGLLSAAAFGVWALLGMLVGGRRKTTKPKVSAKQAVRFARMASQRD